MSPLYYPRRILYLQICCVAVLAQSPQYKLSTPNSNDCTGAGADYVIVTNEADCADANGALNLAEYKGALIDSATPLGCISSSEGVFFNYDPIGSTISNGDTPICKYLTPGTIVPPEYYKLSQANTEDCSTAGVDYIRIEDVAECQSAASEGFLGADFLYSGNCDINFYPEGCFLTDLTNIYYGNMTDGQANSNSSPLCKFDAKPSTMPSDFPSLEESANPTNELSDVPSRLASSTPSLSGMPSISPSLEESANPSDEPSDHPTQSPTASPEPPMKSPTKSPVTTSAPTVAPTTAPITSAPTVAPTIAPTAAPTDGCVDSSLRLKFSKTADSELIVRSCAYVARKKTDERCAILGISEACTDTCGTCTVCEDTSLRIKIPVNGVLKLQSCQYVARRATKQRCRIAGVSDACRKTCEIC